MSERTRQEEMDRLAACWDAFESPDGRTIATENIPEGLVWQMIALLEIAEASPPDHLTGKKVSELLSSLKIEQSDAG